MNVLSKIISILIVVAIAFWLKVNIVDNFLSPDKELKTEVEEVTNDEPIEPKSDDVKPKEYAIVYFLLVREDGQNVFKKVQREVPEKSSKIEFAITELLGGPNSQENTKKLYTEIPRGTKLLSVEETATKVIINLSSNFQYGGGTDSLYSRVQQLVKTAIANAPNKKIYLYLDGKQADVIGGEGVMIKQPLDEKSLYEE